MRKFVNLPWPEMLSCDKFPENGGSGGKLCIPPKTENKVKKCELLILLSFYRTANLVSWQYNCVLLKICGWLFLGYSKFPNTIVLCKSG